jgi:hypothetical protein
VPAREAQALIAAGKSSEARPILEDCATGESPDPRAALLLGQSYLFGRDPDRATLWLERATILDPASSEIQYCSGAPIREQALRASVLHQPALAARFIAPSSGSGRSRPGEPLGPMALVEYGMRAPAFSAEAPSVPVSRPRRSAGAIHFRATVTRSA